MAVSDEPAGEHCATAGRRIDVGIDLDDNGVPDDGNVTSTYVCNGAVGPAGQNGSNGQLGATGLKGADGVNGADGKNGADGGCTVRGSSQSAQGALWFGLIGVMLLRRRRRTA